MVINDGISGVALVGRGESGMLLHLRRPEVEMTPDNWGNAYFNLPTESDLFTHIPEGTVVRVELAQNDCIFWVDKVLEEAPDSSETLLREWAADVERQMQELMFAQAALA